MFLIIIFWVISPCIAIILLGPSDLYSTFKDVEIIIPEGDGILIDEVKNEWLSLEDISVWPSLLDD